MDDCPFCGGDGHCEYCKEFDPAMTDINQVRERLRVAVATSRVTNERVPRQINPIEPSDVGALLDAYETLLTAYDGLEEQLREQAHPTADAKPPPVPPAPETPVFDKPKAMPPKKKRWFQ